MADTSKEILQVEVPAEVKQALKLKAVQETTTITAVMVGILTVALADQLKQVRKFPKPEVA